MFDTRKPETLYSLADNLREELRILEEEAQTMKPSENPYDYQFFQNFSKDQRTLADSQDCGDEGPDMLHTGWINYDQLDDQYESTSQFFASKQDSIVAMTEKMHELITKVNNV